MFVRIKCFYCFQSFILGYALNCTDPTSETELLNCLREMPVDKLLETMEWGVPETLMIQKMFRPTGTIGDDFLPDWPANLMAKGEYNHVDLMVGYTKDEALMQTLQLENNPELYPLMAFQWYDIFGPMFLFGRYGPDITQEDKDMAAALTEWYLGGDPLLNLNPDHFGNLTDLISDAYIWYKKNRTGHWSGFQETTVKPQVWGLQAVFSCSCKWGFCLPVPVQLQGQC